MKFKSFKNQKGEANNWDIFFFSVLVIAVVSGCEFERNKKEKIEQAAKQHAQEETQKVLTEFIARTGADESWKASLKNGESFRTTPILTIELEKLWLMKRPILFEGQIIDIVSQKEKGAEYIIKIKSLDEYEFGLNKLLLNLTCSRDKMALLLQGNPNLAYTPLPAKNLTGGFAFAAKIKKIKPSGTDEKVWVGFGSCVEIGPVIHTEKLNEGE